MKQQLTRRPGFRFVIVALCFLLCLVNYMDRVIISFAIEPIKAEFGLDNTSFGILISAFALGTVSVNALAGWLLDRSNVRIIWSLGIFFWSLMMILLGMAHVLLLFIALRYLLGLGEGINFPAMNRAMADWIPVGELGRMVSVGLLGVPMAMLIGGPLLSHLIEAMGWRKSFISLGVLGILVALACVLLYRKGPFHSSPVKQEPNAEKPVVSWLELLKNPTLLATSWSFFAFGYVLFFAISWMPGYLEQTYNMKLTTIGWFSSLPWALAIVLMLLAGWISDHLMQRSGSIRTSRVHVIWICQLLSVVFFIPLMFSQTPTVAVSCLSFAIGFSMMPNSPYYSICTDLFHQQAGAATGIMVTFFSVSGIVSPLLTGWLTDIFGGFSAAFIALVVIVSSAVLGMVLLAHPDTTERDEKLVLN
jgi:ACS family hexuronate transporter-like MFS transporter